MTKEELKKEAEECIHNILFWLKLPINKKNVEEGSSYILKLLEPREKRIAELIALINAERKRQEECDDVHLRKIADLEKENAELKKNYEDSLVACGVLKAKVDILAQPSPIESMQDALITTQKVAFKKQKEQLTKATEIIKKLYAVYYDPCVTESDLKYRDELFAEVKQFISEVEK